MPNEVQGVSGRGSGGRTRSHLYAGALLLLGLTGCTPFYLVSSHFIEASHDEPPPEITASPDYPRALPQIHKVAIRAPDSCANQTAAAAGGSAASVARILQTRCGVEMSELERALAAAGYAVASWDAIQNRVTHDDVTPLAAAQALGAQVLFQVNSLERSTLDSGQSALWERRFYRSSAKGVQGEPARVEPEIAQQLEQIVAPAEEEIRPAPRLSATVNATAVRVRDGQAIWFYEWTHAEPKSGERSFQVLVRCKKERCTPAQVAPRSSRPGLAAVVARTLQLPASLLRPGRAERISGSHETVHLGARAASGQDAVYHQLVREVVRDLVSRFAGSPRLAGR
ncbi:MAG: hypothetical protein ACE5IL_15540 [Myxococcota bacterium]